MKSITAVLLVLMAFGLLLSLAPNIFDADEEIAIDNYPKKDDVSVIGASADKLFWFAQVG